MQYEAYENKIKKVASVLAVMLRYAVLIVLGLMLVIGATVAVVALKGTVTSCTAPERYAYGESATFEGKAFLSKVSFEFSSDGTEWSSEQPTMPGSYKARTCTKGSFGIKYGAPVSFVIDKAKLEISAADSVPYYGEQPLPSVSGIVAGDSLAQVNFLLSSYEAASAAKPQNGKSVLGYAAAVPDAETIKIVNVAGEDVTGAYDISAIEKRIAISGANSSLKITVEDKDKIYDGIELTWDVYELVEGTLVGEDAMYATFDASIKNIGTVKNTPELVIRNKDGDDVTGFYKMDIIEGNLTVNARQLLIESGSAEFTYDFKAHSCKDYTISNGTLLDGHELVLRTFTEITDVSADGNPYHNVLTFDVMNGTENVTSCYSIMLGSGNLVMKPMTLDVDEVNYSFEYDGKSHSLKRWFKINAETGDVSCTIQNSAVNSNINMVNDQLDVEPLPIEPEPVETYVAITDVGDYDISGISSIFTGENGGVTFPSQNFTVNQTGKITVTPRKIVITAKDVSREYNGKRVDTDTLYDMSGTLCDGHSFSIVLGGLLDKGVGKYDFNLKFSVRLTNKTTDLTHNYDISGDFSGTLETYPRAISVQIHDTSKVYDDTINVDDDNGWSVEGLMEDYQLALTSLYSDRTDAGMASVLADANKVVIIDKDGKEDDLGNYNIKIVPGILTIEKRPINVMTSPAEKVYDGKPLTNHSAYIPSDTPAVPGHNLEPVFLSSSSITEVALGYTYGSAPNELDIDKTKIVRGSDNKDVTKNYEINWIFELLTITQRPITLSTFSGSWTYDGKEHSLDDWQLSKGTLVSGHFLPDATLVDPEAPSFVDAGSYPNEFGNLVVYASGNRDVTHNYNITQESGRLTILQREISIQTATASKVYDTTPLVASKITIHSGSKNKLVSGHTINADTVGLIDVGSISNKLVNSSALWIYDESGKDVTANYKVNSMVYGKLTVDPCPTRIITNSDKQAYNGRPLSNNGATISADIPGAYATIVGNPSITRIGTMQNTCNTEQTRIFDSTGKDITDNFTITGHDYGTLTVVQGMEIQVAVYATQKIYSGRTVTVDLADVTKPIVDSDKFSFDYSAIKLSLTDVGTITLEDLNKMSYLCEVTVAGGDDGVEYVVRFVTPEGLDQPDYACLVIDHKPLEVTARDKTFNYKEEAIFSSNDFDITRGSLASGHTIEVTCDGVIECYDNIYDGYTVDNNISSCRIVDKNGRDVTANYNITCHSGMLTVERLGDVQ